jgi:hypothetical protein
VLRVLSVMLLAAASVAHAGEHYHEVWNPPEARGALPPVATLTISRRHTDWR